jgi:hypothetical protein
MATGIFKLRDQLQGLVQGAWSGKPTASYSGAFNGSTTYLTLGGQSTFAFGSNSFTIEFWFFITTSGYTAILYDARSSGGSSVAYPVIYLNAGALTYYVNGGVIFGATPSVNAWHHVALVRNSGTTIMYLDGTQTGSSWSDSTVYLNGTNAPVIGGQGPTRGVTILPGYMSNLRVVNGSAVYTSNFTPPTAPLTAITNTVLLTLQSPTIIDNSTNAYSITNVGGVAQDNKNPFNIPSYATPAVEYLVVAGGGGGGYISAAGAGGLLQGISNVPSGTSLTVTVGAGGSGGTGGGTGTQGQNSVFGSIAAIGGGYGVNNGGNGGSGGSGASNGVNNLGLIGQGVFGQGNAGGLSLNTGGSYYGGGGGGAGTVGLSATTSNCGNGGAGIASAISGTVTAYAGGGGGGNAFGANNGSGGIGGGGAGGATNGTAGTANTGGGGGASSYNGSFWNGGAGGSGIVIISYPDTYNAPSALTGTYTASTSGSGSLSFSGTGQYLNYGGQSSFAFGTNSWTIEAWIYATSYGSAPTIYDTRPSGTQGIYPTIYLDSAGTYFYVNSAAQITGSILSLNTWYHVAVCKSGSSTKMFINGTQSGSTYTDTNTYLNGASAPFIGSSSRSPNSLLFYGNMSNIRVVNGTALYTANFTPSTTPLTPVTNTVLLLSTNSGAYLADSSTNSYVATVTGSPAWNQLSPFATGLGYKNRVYTWTGSGTITF